MRHAGDGAWWSGAVIPHGTPGSVAAAERFYAAHGAVARFQICDDCPPDLDALLARRGYRRASPVLLMTATGVAARRSDGLRVLVESTMDSAVFTAFVDADGEAAGSGRAVADGEAAGSGRAVADCRAAGSGRAVAGGGAAGIGRAVADGGWTGVFDMVTAPAARRRGVARQILAAIGEWAAAHDAPRLYLQVEESNHAARGLYESMGFTPLTTYHYRVSPGPATSPPRPAAAPGPG